MPCPASVNRRDQELTNGLRQFGGAAVGAARATRHNPVLLRTGLQRFPYQFRHTINNRCGRGIFVILSQAWDRFRNSWVPLVGAGLFALLLQTVISMTVGLMVFGDLLRELQAGRLTLTKIDPALLTGEMVMAGAIMLVVNAVVQGGLVGTVVAVLRGDEAGFTTWWTQAVRHSWRMLKISALSGLLLLLILAVVGMMAIPVLAVSVSLGKLFGLVVGLGLLLPLTVALVYYAPYAATRDETGARQAVATGWSSVSTNFLDCCAAGMVVLGIGLVAGLLMLGLRLVPVIGEVLGLLVQALIFTPLVTLYLGLRYQINQTH